MTTTSPQATTTTVVTLSPSVKRRLLTELHAYAAIKAEIKALEQGADRHKSVIAQIRAEVGVEKVDLDGFKVAYVQPVTSRLVKEKLLAQGVTMAQIEMATETKPTTPYVKISVPGTGVNDKSESK